MPEVKKNTHRTTATVATKGTNTTTPDATRVLSLLKLRATTTSTTLGSHWIPALPQAKLSVPPLPPPEDRVKIMIVGATGTIGSAVAQALEEAGHAVLRVGHSGGDHRVDLADRASVDALYDVVGTVDAVVSTAGIARFGPFAELTDEDYDFSLRHKLMGNVNLIRAGLDRVPQGGSFTLTTGNLTHDPIPGGAVASMVGGAMESYVKAAALEVEGRYRVNAVSPGWVKETMEKLGMDSTSGISAAELAGYYAAVVEGSDTGVIVQP